jgi:hypothetical protein
MITGIKIMKMVEVVSEDDENYFCREFACYPSNSVTLSKKEVKENPEDYEIQRGKPLCILVRVREEE